MSILTHSAASLFAMAEFDQQKAYAQQEEVFYDDGREIELLHFVYSRPNLDKIRGHPQGVLEAIDEFGRAEKYLMNVGEDKGALVVDRINQYKPRVMVELGGYVGYSTILFADAARRAGGKEYYSLERNPEFAAVSASLVDLAGLKDFVTIVVGPSDTSIKRLHAAGTLHHIDLLFLDHHKPLYLHDLKLCEQLGLIGPGTLLAADNVIKPGNPPYLEYVRSTVGEKREKILETGVDLLGNPNLIYESRLIKGFEPSGVPDAIEFTRCIGVEKEEGSES